MSTTLLDAESYGFSLTRFGGGIDRGVCFQIDVKALKNPRTPKQFLPGMRKRLAKLKA